MASIHINYRREDAAGYAGRLHDALAARFGTKSVVRDIEIAPGAEFDLSVENQIREASVQLVVIGQRWLTATDRIGRRQIDDPNDFVRAEIRTALTNGIPVVPVLVEGATMPRPDELPADISAIATRQAIELADFRWDYDVEHLIDRLGVRILLGPSDTQATRYPRSRPPEPTGSKALERVGAAVGIAAARVSAVVGALFRRTKAQPDRDQVKCSLFAPSEVAAGDAVLLQVFAHLPADEARVKTIAQTFDNRTSGRTTKLLDQEIERGTALTFSLTLPGIGIEEPTQSLLWRGEPEAVNFAVTIPPDHTEGRLIGTVVVSRDSVPVGHLKFILDVAAKPASVPRAPSSPEQAWRRYQLAFISYASQDRAEVLKRVQMLDRTGIEFFQDLLSLDPGERWERTLYKKIDDSDVFFLFWSTAAKNSEWVMNEVRYAIARHAGDEMAPPEIVPVLIEGPPPVAPPPELKDLHFNDRFLYFVAGSARPESR